MALFSYYSKLDEWILPKCIRRLTYSLSQVCVIQIYIKKNLEVTANLIEKVSSDLRLPEIFSCNKQGALVLNAGFATRLSEEGPRFAQSCTTRASFVLPILFNKGLSQKLR